MTDERSPIRIHILHCGSMLVSKAVPYGGASRALNKRKALEASAVLGRAGMQGRKNYIRSPRSGKAAGGTVYSVPEPSGNV